MIATRRTGRPPLVDRATIVRAARKIPIDDLTIGAVMAQLGLKYTTFYRHFSSHEALLAAVVEDILAEIDVSADSSATGASSTWVRRLNGTFAALFGCFERNSGLARAVLRLPQLPGRINEAYAAMARSMLDAGFSAEDAVLGASMMIELAASPFLDLRDDVASAQLRRSQAHAALDDLPVAVRRATARAVDGPASAWVQRKVDLVIEGLAARRSDNPTE